MDLKKSDDTEMYELVFIEIGNGRPRVIIREVANLLIKLRYHEGVQQFQL